MKSIVALLSIMLLLASCTKPNHTPEGPTDVRIRNITDQDFNNVIVDTGGGNYNYGDIPAGTETNYHRFEKAYPDAEITVMINGEEYTTGEQDYTYATYIGPDKITYVVFISNPDLRKLEVDVILEGPIDDK
jgi:hypothetical protein